MRAVAGIEGSAVGRRDRRLVLERDLLRVAARMMDAHGRARIGGIAVPAGIGDAPRDVRRGEQLDQLGAQQRERSGRQQGLEREAALDHRRSHGQTLGGAELARVIRTRIEAGHGQFYVLVPMIRPEFEASWMPADAAFGLPAAPVPPDRPRAVVARR